MEGTLEIYKDTLRVVKIDYEAAKEKLKLLKEKQRKLEREISLYQQLIPVLECLISEDF